MAALVGLALGCGPAVDGMGTAVAGSTSEASSSSSTTTTSSEDTTTGLAEGSTTTFGGQTETGDVPATSAASGGFIYGSPDGGVETFQCSVYDQDCPADQKCMPWANDGGSDWNATRCTPLDADPGDVGDPCTTEGSPVSGIDTCVRGALCLVTDEALLEGTCVEMCSGTDSAPVCMTEGTTCADPSAVAPLCL